MSKTGVQKTTNDMQNSRHTCSRRTAIILLKQRYEKTRVDFIS